jgi:propane monooxygenase small subunit
VHEVVDEYLAGDELADPDVYMCGPPPMLEAAEQMLSGRGVEPSRIFQDRFTTAADSGAVRSAPETPSARETSEREFSWFEPHGRRATLYEDVTIDTQPSIHRHLRRGWPLSFEGGRGTWNDASTTLRSGDWFAFRDPGELWERPFYQAGAAAEQQIEGALRSAGEQGLIEDFSPSWVAFLEQFLQVPAFVEHGLWFALATAARDCLSDSVATCVCLQAAMKQRSAQAIVLYAMDLEQHLGHEFPIEPARQSFLHEKAWQPTRRYLERLAATADWGEVLLAANLCFEPTVATLIRRELGTRAAAANGDTVTPVLARVETQEWEWARSWTVALTRFLVADAEHGSHNREVIAGWVSDWLPQALAAASALAPVAASIGVDITRAGERVAAYAGQTLADAGVPELCQLVGYEPAVPSEVPRSQAGPVKSGRSASARHTQSTPSEDGAYDFVGIVMAKSAEGDAVARFLARREDIEVLEQPAFWDIRARDRLVIPYDQISEELGYQIDAYSIQHEMSTHYGRMVATDDSLMLFSDPTEAMEHLLS